MELPVNDAGVTMSMLKYVSGPTIACPNVHGKTLSDDSDSVHKTGMAFYRHMPETMRVLHSNQTTRDHTYVNHKFIH